MENSQSQQASTTPSVATSNVRKQHYTNDDVELVRPTTRKGDVWSNFDMCVMKDGNVKARCRKCGHFYGAGSNTTLRNHIGSCKAVVNDGSQGTIGADGQVFIYDADALRIDFAKFVIQQGLPFNHFDNVKLTEIIKTRLQPRYQHVSRTTLRSDAFKLWKTAKKEIIEGFREYKYGVSITTDTWTAPHGTANSYLAVTAHWFNPESWLLMKRTIAFKIFGYPHTGCNLRKILHDTLIEYNLDDKVFTISLDNASNNTRAMDLLKLRVKPILDGAFFHSRCVAHVINLSVQAALKICDSLYTKFRGLLVLIYKSSNERQINYRRFRKICNEEPLGPCFDNNTRWNSTCMMFENILRQRATLQAFNQRLINRNVSTIILTDQDWDRLNELTMFLQVFKEATTILSGVYYPTSPLVLKQIYAMTEKLYDLKSSPSRMFRKMVKIIKKKFIKYFASLPLVFTCSAALNPCLNVGGVELLIRKIMENLGLSFGLDGDDADYIESQIFRFNDHFQKLFGIYATKYGHQQNPIVDQMRAGSSRMTRDININLYNSLFEDATRRQRSSAPTSELGQYMATNFLRTLSPDEFANFDILAWWKEREIQYPVLSAMARDLLAVQASTVASESAFSVSGRIISDRRTRLTCESVEVCVCLKDYLDGVDRIQHESSLEGPILDKDVEEGIIREEEEAGISPSSSTSNTEGELDEGEFEEFEVEDLDVQDFLEENDLDDDLSD